MGKWEGEGGGGRAIGCVDRVYVCVTHSTDIVYMWRYGVIVLIGCVTHSP